MCMGAHLSVALQDALRLDQPDIIELNLTKRPKATRWAELDQCLHVAMPSGSLTMIAKLLDIGARLCMTSHYATIARQDPSIFELLVKAGWDMDSTDFNRAAIHIAVNHTASLQWLLTHGADPNIKSRRGKNGGSVTDICTAMAWAAKLSDPTAVQTLINYGVEIDPLAIFYAIGGMRFPRNGTATLRALVDAGADVNFVSTRWGTPLQHAMRYGGTEKVKLLLERGADPDGKCSRGRVSARGAAMMQGLGEYVDMMQEAKPAPRRSMRIAQKSEKRK